MSIWVRVFCRKKVSSIKPEELLEGIAKRFRLLTLLFGEDDEESEALVLQLRLEDHSQDQRVLLLFGHRRQLDRFVRIEFWSNPGMVQAELGELREALDERKEPEAASIRERLEDVVESVGFELKPGDIQGVSWPIIIAAAAYLAEQGDGVIYADDEGWMIPTDVEVRYLLEDRKS